MAEKIKKMLESAMDIKAYGITAPNMPEGITASGIGAILPGSSRLIQDKESGINILKPSKRKMPADANPFE